jgi:nicotinamide mononucleotide transporter
MLFDLRTVAETLAVALGVLYVVLAVRQNAWCWPAGLASAALFAGIFLQARLLGSAALQVVYVGLSIYGWHAWLHGGQDRSELRVSRTPARALLGLGLAALVASVAAGKLLERSGAALPFVDGPATAVSLAAQWMATRKWLENWLVWIAVDLVYVVMYSSQALYTTTLLYAFFLVMAVLGYREWRRCARTQGAAQ